MEPGLDDGKGLPDSEVTEAYGKWMLARKVVRKKGRYDNRKDFGTMRGEPLEEFKETTMHGNFQHAKKKEGAEKDPPKNLGGNSFAILQEGMEEFEEVNPNHGDYRDYDDGRSDQRDLIFVEKETRRFYGDKGSGKANSKKSTANGNNSSKNKGKGIVKNSQSVVIKKNNSSGSVQGVQIRERVSSGLMTVQNSRGEGYFKEAKGGRKGAAIIAASSDFHVLVRGSNKTNEVSHTTIPNYNKNSTLDIIPMEERFMVENFHDPSIPHQPVMVGHDNPMEESAGTIECLSSGAAVVPTLETKVLDKPQIQTMEGVIPSNLNIS